MNSSYFPFERQLGKCNVVGWACWTAWCMSARNMYAVNRVMSSAFRETRTIGLTTKAMVLCHVPGEALGVDEATVLLSGALELYDDANKNSYFCSYYKRQVAQRCIAVIGRISDAKEQLSALAMLADLRAGGSGQREQFVLAAAAALTKQGTRILCAFAPALPRWIVHPYPSIYSFKISPIRHSRAPTGARQQVCCCCGCCLRPRSGTCQCTASYCRR